jgi:Tol biopolymer transport system component
MISILSSSRFPEERRAIVNSTRYDGSGVWSPSGGTLAYVANRGRGDEIWMRSGDTPSDRRLLTSDDFTGSRPDFIKALTFSPDRQWLAFTAFSMQPSVNSGVWVIPIGGGTPRRVSPKDVLVTKGTWSPDGRQMALYGLRNESAELWMTSIGGSESRQVALPDGLGIREMEWSPTGESIAALEFRSDGPRPTVLIDPSNGGIKLVPGLTAAVLTWLRDGKRLYGLGGERIRAARNGNCERHRANGCRLLYSPARDRRLRQCPASDAVS